MKLSYYIILFLSLPLFAATQKNLTDFPAEASPITIGNKVAERFLLSPHGVYNAPNTKPHIPYFEVCTWYGALTFANETNNNTLRKQLIERFNTLFTTDSSLLPVPDHVDYTVFGSIPLEIYLQTWDKRYYQLGKMYADTQWGIPTGPRVIPTSYSYHNEGYTWQTRMWIDDMYMITLIQAQAYRATGDKRYIERAAREMVLYLDSLQKPNGLFYHAPDAPFYWGRGNGWMATGMTELLRALPKDNPHRPRIMAGYLMMMQSLLKYQGENGMWRQLVDDAESWFESSGTGMFTFAMITGIKNGWLDNNTYAKAAMNGWLGLIKCINEKGEVKDVCEGTGKKNDRQYYLDRKRITGDFHGQAPVLWCATALLRNED